MYYVFYKPSGILPNWSRKATRRRSMCNNYIQRIMPHQQLHLNVQTESLQFIVTNCQISIYRKSIIIAMFFWCSTTFWLCLVYPQLKDISKLYIFGNDKKLYESINSLKLYEHKVKCLKKF